VCENKNEGGGRLLRDGGAHVQTKAMETKYKRLYKAFPGNNKFCCFGLFIFGPDRLFFFLAFLLIVIPAFLYCWLVWPFFFIFVPLYVTIPLCVVYVILLAMMLGFMVLTRYRDPGIIPRGLPVEYDPENPFEYDQKKPAEALAISIAGQKHRVKYCETCNIYRPPRCIHCSTCNNCVERFDHHCPWVGNCVGRRNHQTFLAFVWSVVAGCIYVEAISVFQLVFAIIRAVDESDSSADRFLFVLRYCFFSVFMMVYCLVALGLVGYLGSFHCFLVSLNQTTNEKMKGMFKKRRNPYSHNAFWNCLRLWFPPHYPSSQVYHRRADQEEIRSHRRKGWPNPEAEKRRQLREALSQINKDHDTNTKEGKKEPKSEHNTSNGGDKKANKKKKKKKKKTSNA